ncbi:Response regulator protein TmoT [Caulifigura coniformis]|uniref:Response regulator protein TmoT n=1 Tax=Caulifigura coniformis TaxID=2527983 RepID=A0A517SMU8_9PLAN|nr:response regulator [Caulifigura coniformis]QDT57454.1 Response regulator protein TmoT [Caulifigura coniformis]
MLIPPQPDGPVVRVVDDDPSVCGLITSLLTGHGLRVQTYRNAMDFFQAFDPAVPGCLVSDVRMPGMTGIELQERLKERGWLIPTIIISGDLDVPTALRAMKNHPVDVLEKPFLPRVLLERVRHAIEIDQRTREEVSRSEDVTRKLASLTSREREVLQLVVSGHANKHVARSLDITEKTVEAHRGRLMKKLGARNVVELVRMTVDSDSAVRS